MHKFTGNKLLELARAQNDNIHIVPCSLLSTTDNILYLDSNYGLWESVPSFREAFFNGSSDVPYYYAKPLDFYCELGYGKLTGESIRCRIPELINRMDKGETITKSRNMFGRVIITVK